MSNGLVVCRSENIFLLSMPKCLGDKKRDFQSTTNDRQKDEKIVKNHSDFLECTHIIERSAAKSIDPSWYRFLNGIINGINVEGKENV